MAEVVPFVGLRYAVGEDLSDLAQVLTPPYDVISPEAQDEFYERHPLNFIRVDLGKELPSDDEFENRYTRAHALLTRWQSEGALKEDERRTFTAYEQAFRLPDGREIRRRGVLALVKLEDLETGGIHAHEHTFMGPKSDRFKLLRATGTNTSPVFSVYRDPSNTVGALLDGEMARDPWAQFTDTNGVTHRAWVIEDEKVCRSITSAMAKRDLYIADGHHRYEVSLLYRDHMREQLKTPGVPQPFDWTLMFLCNADDEGTVILPTHRALARELDDGVDTEEFFDELRTHFFIKKRTIDLDNKDAGRDFAAEVAAAGSKRASFGVALLNGQAAILTLRRNQKRSVIVGRKIPPAIRALDVTLLHEFIIRQAWVGNPEMEFDEHDIIYHYDPDHMLGLLRRRKACAVFIINPPTIEQLVAVAEKGLRMPHKSTFFYPKVVSGLVMRDMKLT